MNNKELEIITQEFEKIGRIIKVQSHETLVEFHERSKKVYLVKSGGLVLLHVNPLTGNERAINFFIPDFHPIATVIESFAYQTPSKYRLATFTSSELIEIDKSIIEEYMSSANTPINFQEFALRSLIEKNEIRALLISLSSEEMLLYLHEHYPQIIRRVPSKYIADFLGITPQWLSKLKHKI